jgi:DNA-directed RNA polymerase subunit L
MANNREVTVNIRINVDDAVKALKTIQREAREATKALRELEAADSK